ncbi:MAG: hypothetical protein HOL17_05525 [Gammaproteobacteria bacterium]|jgi:hypothetical protein|nr:hypothetical protein [Gammaproteobacteria bacterium]
MKNDVLNKLSLLFKKYSPKSKPSVDSEMCLFWSIKNPPDILEGTKQLEAIEAEFEIEITEDEAVEMYDMNLQEASEYIQKLIMVQ